MKVTFDTLVPAEVAEVQRLLAAAPQANRPATLPNAAAKPAAAKPAAAAGNGLTYEKDVKPLALALSKTQPGYDALRTIWAGLGVTVGTELKPEQFSDAIAQIKQASAPQGGIA